MNQMQAPTPPAGMPPKPGGGLPPQLMNAPANAGAATVPQANQGNITAAITKVRNAMKMMEEALPLIPMGQELHSDILTALKNFSKHIKQDANPGMDQASLLQSLRQNAQGSNQDAMMKLMAAKQGAGMPPATPQAPPQQ